MKVLLKQTISKLGKIGDVVDVKPGYARNYLLPQDLATQPTEANVRAIESAKQAYLEELAKQRSEIEAQAAVVNGKEVTIAARANEEGHLYGSIGPAQIAAALANEGVFIDSEHIVLDAPIRQLDKYELQIRFAEGISAGISVWVVPTHEESDESGPAETSDQDAPANEADEASE